MNLSKNMLHTIKRDPIAWTAIGICVTLLSLTLIDGCKNWRLRTDAETTIDGDTSDTDPLNQGCNADINGDGRCGKDDIFLVKGALGACQGNPLYLELADQDHDGCITEEDQDRLFPMFVRNDGGPACDLDNNGECDQADYELFVTSLHTCFGDPQFVKDELHLEYNPHSDADRNGCVDFADRELLFPTVPEE